MQDPVVWPFVLSGCCRTDQPSGKDCQPDRPRHAHDLGRAWCQSTNPRVLKCVYWLTTARKEGRNLARCWIVRLSSYATRTPPSKTQVKILQMMFSPTNRSPFRACRQTSKRIEETSCGCE